MTVCAPAAMAWQQAQAQHVLAWQQAQAQAQAQAQRVQEWQQAQAQRALEERAQAPRVQEEERAQGQRALQALFEWQREGYTWHAVPAYNSRPVNVCWCPPPLPPANRSELFTPLQE